MKTEWNEFEAVRLQMTQVGSPGTMSSYLQTSRPNNDLRVDIDITGPEKPQHGTMLMVGGRVFVSKGLTLDRAPRSGVRVVTSGSIGLVLS